MAEATTPAPVRGLHDGPMWQSIGAREMRLQCCAACGTFRYPPGPCCPACMAEEAAWKALRGTGEVLSWVVFHRTYLPAYPAPYTCIAVRLDEGPVMIANLAGPAPATELIGQRVRMVYATMPDGVVLPRFELVALAPGMSPV